MLSTGARDGMAERLAGLQHLVPPGERAVEFEFCLDAWNGTEHGAAMRVSALPLRDEMRFCASAG